MYLVNTRYICYWINESKKWKIAYIWYQREYILTNQTSPFNIRCAEKDYKSLQIQKI
jgi:hypothetical protein